MQRWAGPLVLAAAGCAFEPRGTAGEGPTPDADAAVDIGATTDAALDAAEPPAPASCREVLTTDPAALDGMYDVDPDGPGGLAAFPVYCDMSAGGWTLIMASAGVAPADQATTTPVLPGVAAHLPKDRAIALAVVSTQVHIRTEGMPDDSVTSVPGAAPIEHLRAGRIVNASTAATASAWIGARVGRLTYSCDKSATLYPSIYWACGNATGLHLMSSGTQRRSRWIFNAATDDRLEVYVR
ncbi:MAG: fibrinogen-like YCDxxxxGGGW domain-containing protein [Kofleriaceae bacterium]